MEWRKCYLDVILVPLAMLISIGYHVWLWHKVRTQPHTTIVGINASGRRNWVNAMMKDNEKKNILAVQSLRNTIMGATLMATTSILLCSGLAAVISSTYSVKKPLNDAIYGAHGEFMVALKYVSLLTIFLFSFFCHSLSIRFINQVNILINTPQDPMFILNAVGNRLFYAGLPLLLWIFGPVMVFLCSLAMVPVLYNLDFVYTTGKGKMNVDQKEDYV
ncbi:plant/F12B17-70 protein [Medicago truncatula]|uniref:Plant/F12B17-70 protein n=1 Tax=Medicago truncatula TaxID=3880 RepID=G7I551_MEDTR|nr:plant/F12B17-70 protein [Medicago truncatula]